MKQAYGARKLSRWTTRTKEASATRGYIFSVMAVTLIGLHASAADRSYFELFTSALANETSRLGFVTNLNLVDTSNPGPVISNAPISFERFRNSGELLGLKLA